MKQLLCLVALIALCLPVMAEDTGGAKWNSEGILWISGEGVNDFLNDSGALNHKHYIDKKDRVKLGLGLDIVCYESKSALLEEVVVETRIDLNNDKFDEKDAYSAMLVGKVNLWKLIKGE